MSEGYATETRAAERGTAAGNADLELARRALAGELDARGELVHRLVCVPRMLAALNARVGRPLGPHDLEDLVQDVLVALWRGLPSFAGLSSLDSWAFRCCHRALLARLRRPRWGAAHGEGVEALAAVQGHAFDEIHRALDQLEPRARRVIELKHFEGLTFVEIGARLATSPNTVKGWYYETLADLRRMLASASRGARE